MISWLKRIHLLHSWSKWSLVDGTAHFLSYSMNATVQTRQCTVCGKREVEKF